MHQLIIIGAGPAGLTAGLYAKRAGLDPLMLEKISPGGKVLLTEKIENYPGFPEGISGWELAEKIKKQIVNYKLNIIQAEVISILKNSKTFLVKTDEKTYETLAIIIATGAEPNRLDVKGENELKGVSYCAVCDGPLFQGKKVAVVGGGDRALEDALFLAKFAEEVQIIHRRGKLRATKILQERCLSNKKISFMFNSTITEIIGKSNVGGIKIKNVLTSSERILPCDAVFVAIGMKPKSEFVKGLVELDESGYIITDENMKTSVDGIYACGDVRKKPLRQVITACSDGAIASFSVQKYIEKCQEEKS